jgi:ribokinase
MALEPTILVVGALHLDVVVTAPHLPTLDETVMGLSVAYPFGGKGGNQAVAAACLGAPVAMAGRVGQDSFGAHILAALDAAGVERSQVLSGPGASGMSVAIVDQAGDYGAVVVCGVNKDIDGAAVRVRPQLQAILLQNEVPEAVNLAVTAQANEDTLVILNAAPARPLAPALLQRVDVLIVNRGEAAALARTHDPAEAARWLLALGVQIVVVTLGADGLMCKAADGTSLRLPARQAQVHSTHGAGDAFVGALAVRMVAGDPLPLALDFARTYAALIVETPPDARATVDKAAVMAAMV